MNTRGPSRKVRGGNVRPRHAEANSTAAVDGSSKAHTRPTEATGTTAAKASSSTRAATAAVKTTAANEPTTTPAVRSGPSWGSKRHRCNANY